MKKDYKLRINWSKKEQDLEVHYPLGINTNRDSNYLIRVFPVDFIKEMTDRGYDITKFKLEIPININREDKFSTLIKELKNG